MKFTPGDRMLELGVVPALTNHVKEAYPEASASLWQRDAKRTHRRIVDTCRCAPEDGPFSRQGHALVSLAALLLGFHVAAPEGTEVDAEAFGRMVDVALATPIVQMTFASAQACTFSEEGRRELSSLLQAPSGGVEPGVWHGTLSLEGEAGQPGCVLACTVSRCGLMDMCVCEKRFFLLERLCVLEKALAAANGLDLTCTSCVARGDRICELRCSER